MATQRSCPRCHTGYMADDRDVATYGGDRVCLQCGYRDELGARPEFFVKMRRDIERVAEAARHSAAVRRQLRDFFR